VITEVEISKRAQKQLQKLPRGIIRNIQLWVQSVATTGLEEVRKIPGYHDEPLKGNRTGQRSIRLNRSYRAIYEIKNDGTVKFVSVEEVSKHDY
jgi:toxin HigB-1